MENYTLVLIPGNASFRGKKIVIVNQPISLGRVLDGQDPSVNPPNWLRFASKVVSRQHCKITFADSKFYIQDTKSSSGTFVNGERLSVQGVESAPKELHDGDMIRLGEDYNQDGVVHLCVLFKVRLPGSKIDDDEPTTTSNTAEEEANNAHVETSMDNEVRATLDAQVDDEFNTIWNSLISDLNMPLKKLRSGALLQPANANTRGTNSPYSTQTYISSKQAERNDNTVTLIKVSPTPDGSTHSTTSGTYFASITFNSFVDSGSNSNLAPKQPSVDPTVVQDCVTFVESLQWESPELRDTLVELAKKQDQQLIAFYKSLKGFPSSFMNVASKYAKYSKSKK